MRRAHLAAARLDNIFAELKLNIVEDEHSVRFLRVALAVYFERYLRAVGVDFYRALSGGSVDISFAGDVNELLVAPVCLVEPERVFLRLAVECHKTLVVSASDAALVSRCGAEVKHVPDI